MRRKKKLDPKTQWIITDPTNQPVAPPFYHQELAKSVMRELSRDINGRELRQEAAASDGSFVEAVHVLSREDRWIPDSVLLFSVSRQVFCFVGVVVLSCREFLSGIVRIFIRADVEYSNKILYIYTVLLSDHLTVYQRAHVQKS